MAIIKPEPGKSYAALRAKHPPKRTEKLALNIKPRTEGTPRDDPAAKPEKPTADNPSDKMVDEAITADRQEKVAPSRPEPASSSDREEQEPASRGATQTDGAETDQSPQSGNRDRAEPDTTEADPTVVASGARDEAAQTEKIGIRGNIPEPAPGVFSFYDKARQFYSQREAMKGLFGRIDTEKLRETGKVADYPTSKQKVLFTAKLPLAQYEKHRAAVDPLGIMAPFTVDSQVLQRILALHLEAQKAGSA